MGGRRVSVIRTSEVTLLSPAPRARGVYDTAAENRRTVTCEVKNVTRAEAYEAMSHGHSPQWILDIGHYENYQDETSCLFEGKRYTVLRAYVTKNLHMELTIERLINRGDAVW